jgi:hypothetical protein
MTERQRGIATNEPERPPDTNTDLVKNLLQRLVQRHGGHVIAGVIADEHVALKVVLLRTQPASNQALARQHNCLLTTRRRSPGMSYLHIAQPKSPHSQTSSKNGWLADAARL